MLILDVVTDWLNEKLADILRDVLPGTDEVLGWISSAIRSVFMFLCKPIYSLIGYVFSMFEVLGNARLLEQEVGFIFDRINLILGLFMIFRLSLYAIQYIVNPDNMSDNKVGIGNVIKKVLIVIVLLGSTRFIFNEAYDINKKLVDSHVVDTVILGPNLASNNDNSSNSSKLAWYSFSTFYKPDDNVKDKLNNDDKRHFEGCERVYSLLENEFRNSNDLSYADYCLNLATEKGYSTSYNDKKVNYYYMEFDGLLCLITGIFLLYTLITYSIKLGVRLFQLAYLEIIAPIPIMMYLTPDGDEKLKNWGMQCLMTFLDYFIRIAIIDFIIVAVIELSQMDFSSVFETSNVSGFWNESYLTIIMFIALMQFAKKIPDLIKEILPFGKNAAGMDYGIGLGGLKKVGSFAAGTVGAGVGFAAGGMLGAASGIKNGKGFLGKTGGAFGGLARGMYHGSGAKDLAGKVSPSKLRGRVSGGLAAQRSAAEARNKAIEEKHSGLKYVNKEKEEQIKRGGNLYNKYGNNLANAFKSSDYAKSYLGLQRAKSNVKTAKNQLTKAEDNYKLAMSRGDASSISAAKQTLSDARKANELAQKQLEAANSSHDKNKEKYKSDAKIESDYDAYNEHKDAHETSLETYRPLSESSLDANNIRFADEQRIASTTESTVPTQVATASESSSWANSPVEPFVSPQRAEEQSYENMLNVLSSGASDEEKQAAMNNYNEASAKRQELDNQLDDFYDNMNDIGGGFGGGYN